MERSELKSKEGLNITNPINRVGPNKSRMKGE